MRCFDDRGLFELFAHPQDVHHFGKRALEWWFAAYTALFGLWVLLPMESMNNTAFDIVVGWADEHMWGAFLCSSGIIHLAALWINGRRWWTPFVRIAATTISLAPYSLLASAFAIRDIASTAVFTYSAISAAAMICIYRAVKDAVHALEIRRASKCLNCRPS